MRAWAVLCSRKVPRVVSKIKAKSHKVTLARLGARLAIVFAGAMLSVVPGCHRHELSETVWVSARQASLRDRVAAVSNRVAQVENGEQLKVLEHGRRFLKVITPKNETGWIEERAVVDVKTHEAFERLVKDHAQDPVVAVATLRDDVYLHLSPGRKAERFFLLAGNAKVQLLARTSVVKGAPGAQAAHKAAPVAAVNAQTPAPAAGAKSSAATPGKEANKQTAGPESMIAEPPPMEDWWLVRDGQGHAGWLMASRVDVDVPDEIGAYAEGQRIVGAYVLAKVTDPESTTPDHQVPEYVTALSTPKSGLAYDFDQVRVFTWSVKHHRYETAFRLHPIEGYLPMKAGTEAVNGGNAAIFSFLIADGTDKTTDPRTGTIRPARTRTVRFELDDTRVKRIGPDMTPIPVTHTSEDKPKKGKAQKKGRK